MLFELFCPTTSDALIEYIVVPTAVGVPVNSPVFPLNTNPLEGIGVINQTIGSTPPAAVTGVNGVTASPIVKTVLGIACMVNSSGGSSTTSWKILELVCPSSSVTVIV
jgi:hypothetical protein